MNETNLKKGDRAFLVWNWDSRGTVTLIPVIVAASGEKQILLTDLEGKPIKYIAQNFRPTWSQVDGMLFEADAENPEAIALEWARARLSMERQRLEQSLTSGGVYYRESIRRELEALHEPRILEAGTR